MRTLFLLSILITASFCACTSSNNDEPMEPQNKPKERIWRFQMEADMNDVRDAAARLDSLETAELRFKTIISMAMGLDLLTRGATIPLSCTGNITKKGTIKTLWKYGVGQNLVPAGLCGAYSVSEWYEVSGHVKLEIPGVTYRNVTGEFSGWSGRNIENPQTPFQANRGTETEPDFVTFIYDIRSGADGTTPPGGHLWVPVSQDKVTLYCDAVLPD